MSILISGMDMPKCCIDCPIYDNEFGMCNLIPDSCFYDKGSGEPTYDPFEERNKDCPLREVD